MLKDTTANAKIFPKLLNSHVRSAGSTRPSGRKLKVLTNVEIWNDDTGSRNINNFNYEYHPRVSGIQ